MNRTLLLPAVLALVAVIGLIAAGCGSSASSDTGTATSTAIGSSAGTASHTSSAGTTKLDLQEKLVKLAECIRGHGVPHFPDPDAKGEFAFGIDVTPAEWLKAVNACKELEPPGIFSGRRSPKQQSDALRFAECMRENGVKDFPDPANGEPLIDTYKIPSSNRPGGMIILRAAMKQCGPIVRVAAGGQG
jgi:hypothetical protein